MFRKLDLFPSSGEGEEVTNSDGLLRKGPIRIGKINYREFWTLNFNFITYIKIN
jgi:hypothetical protein